MHESLPVTQFIHRPGVIDLGWGHPDGALLPVEDLREAAQRALERAGARALAYGTDRGPGPLLAWICERAARAEGRAPRPDEIVLTGGASHALDLLCALWTRPGDVALVEAPVYHLGMQILRDHALELVAVPSDAHGLRIDALAAALEDLRRSGRRARLLYTIPTFNNPTGVCLSAERRAALVELAVAEDLLIVEDDVYRELAYEGSAPPSLWSIAPPGAVARLGSFSKPLAPGLRIGWLMAGDALAGRIAGSGLLQSGGGVNHFTAMIVAEFCAEGRFDAQVARLRAAYRARRDALMAALAEHLPPGCAWSVPDGGFFVWVALPDEVEAEALLTRADAAGVGYVPGAQFYAGVGGSNALRLAFTLYPPEELAEAARRLGMALRG